MGTGVQISRWRTRQLHARTVCPFGEVAGEEVCRENAGLLAGDEAVGEGFGHGPAEGDNGLTLLGLHRADQLGGRLATGLGGARVEHGLGRAVALEACLLYTSDAADDLLC